MASSSSSSSSSSAVRAAVLLSLLTGLESFHAPILPGAATQAAAKTSTCSQQQREELQLHRPGLHLKRPRAGHAKRPREGRPLGAGSPWGDLFGGGANSESKEEEGSNNGVKKGNGGSKNGGRPSTNDAAKKNPIASWFPTLASEKGVGGATPPVAAVGGGKEGEEGEEKMTLMEKVTDYLQQPFSFPWRDIGFGFGGLTVGVGLCLGIFLSPYSALSPDVQKSLTLFENVLIDLDQNYVDPVDADKLTATALSSMLRSLDPYTEFQSVGQARDMRESVMGRYGGVGLVIAGDKRPVGLGGEPVPTTTPLPDVAAPALPAAPGGGEGGGGDSEEGVDPRMTKPNIDGEVMPISTAPMTDKVEGAAGGQDQTVTRSITVVSALEGYAFDAGLRPGDRIIEIDGVPLRGASVDKVRDMLRGEPNSQVVVKFERDAPPGSSPGPKEVTLTRGLIRLRDVKLTVLVGKPSNGVGYIQLSGFTAEAGREVKAAILALQAVSPGGKLNGLVLDLRGNPGGLLESAVDVSTLFVPVNSDIVSAKGRSFMNVLYRSNKKPLLDADTRLAVLVNGGTASAAEIVSGAIQDLDVGVIVGANKGRTYGKGLVQNVAELPYDNALKFTVAKYYTPSGRCIQSVNYKEGNAASEAGEGGPGYTSEQVADKDRKSFTTAKGRLVRDGGGVEADVKVDTPKLSALEVALQVQGAFFDYAGEWAKGHQMRGVMNLVDDKTLADFKTYVMAKHKSGAYKLDIIYDSQLSALKSALTESGLDAVEKEVEPLGDAIVKEMAKDFDSKSDSIRGSLEDAILSRYVPESMVLQHQLLRDEQFKKAVAIVSDPALYDSILTPGTYPGWALQGETSSNPTVASAAVGAAVGAVGAVAK